MDCGRCGSWIECPRAGDIFWDGDEVTCSDCGSVNRITVDDADPEDPPGVSVQGYTCAHGIDGDDPCVACSAECGCVAEVAAARPADREGA